MYLLDLNFMTREPKYAGEIPLEPGRYIHYPETRLVSQPPQVGLVFREPFYEGDAIAYHEDWVVAHVLRYSSDRFYSVTCTKDGQYPDYCTGWEHNEPHELTIFTGLDLEPLEEEDGEPCYSSYFGPLGSSPGAEPGLTIVHTETLKPVEPPLPWGYHQVTIHRCTAKAWSLV